MSNMPLLSVSNDLITIKIYIYIMKYDINSRLSPSAVVFVGVIFVVVVVVVVSRMSFK